VDQLLSSAGMISGSLVQKIEIPEEKIKEISEELATSKTSVSSEEMVKKYFGLEPSSDLFELYCLSLNFLFEKKYRKDFICLSTKNWGKWHLKSVLNKLPEGLPISSPWLQYLILGRGKACNIPGLILSHLKFI